MTALRYFTDRAAGLLVATGLSSFLAYSLSRWLGARADPPAGPVPLAGDQLQLALVVVAAGAALAALIGIRHHRRAGRDLWVTAARSPLRLHCTELAAVAVPVLGSWLVYLAVTSVRYGSAHELAPALAVQLMSVLALATGIALGQYLALAVPVSVAVPAAFAAGYVGTGFVSGAGDDYWWQWLGPGFGDGMQSPVHAAWLAGEVLWFGGVTAGILLLAARRSAPGRATPRLPAAVTGAALLAGAVLLFVNGDDATG
ncbi:MAG TPA: hypothetical protein VGP02_00135 [Mycobacteriales bacterium]|nr:hypothetical protein [Mycobacteriales bacterium]